MQRRDPAVQPVFDDRIACIGRARFDDMAMRCIGVVRRQAHAARVDDQGAATRAHRTCDVTVAAQHDRGGFIAQPQIDLLGTRRAHATGFDRLEKVFKVAARRTVAQQHFLAERLAMLQLDEPVEFAFRQLRVGVGIRRLATVAVGKQDLAFVVACKVDPVLRHQELSRFERQQRSRQAVAEVHRAVHTVAPDVPDHRLEGRQVPVDVGDNGDAHAAS